MEQQPSFDCGCTGKRRDSPRPGLLRTDSETSTVLGQVSSPTSSLGSTTRDDDSISDILPENLERVYDWYIRRINLARRQLQRKLPVDQYRKLNFMVRMAIRLGRMEQLLQQLDEDQIDEEPEDEPDEGNDH